MTTPFSGPPISSISGCIGNPSEACDTNVAQACVGSNSINCACINSPIPCATTSYSLCSNNPSAYKPISVPVSCTAPITCTNTISTGSNALVDETMQICSAEQPIIFNMLYIVLFFVIIALLTFITTIIFVRHTTSKLIKN